MANKQWSGICYIIYDERGIDDPDEAAALESCDSLREVRMARDTWNARSAVWKYIVRNGKSINEKFIGLLGEA
jgi:hypothetical protein